MVVLPEPPKPLTPRPKQFYDELRRMIEMVRPRDLARIGVSFENGGVDVTLHHATESDWTIEAIVGQDGAMVGIWSHRA